MCQVCHSGPQMYNWDEETGAVVRSISLAGLLGREVAWEHVVRLGCVGVLAAEVPPT